MESPRLIASVLRGIENASVGRPKVPLERRSSHHKLNHCEALPYRLRSTTQREESS